MDILTLYELALTAARGASDMCERYARAANRNMCRGYEAYAERYNALRTQAIESFGKEASDLFSPMPIERETITGKSIVLGAQVAEERLNALATYLRSKSPVAERQVIEMIDLVEAKLRAVMFRTPEKERDVADQLEAMFKTRSMEYLRETVHIPYSGKDFVPDFTFDSQDTALEVKFCDSDRKSREIVDDMNADIPAYQTKYSRVVFVVYDMGFIRDVGEFKSGLERNTNVHVRVVKH